MVDIQRMIQTRKRRRNRLKRNVLSVGKCVQCGSTENLTMDHILPKSKGGKDELKNLQCLCFPCNIKKGDKTAND